MVFPFSLGTVKSSRMFVASSGNDPASPGCGDNLIFPIVRDTVTMEETSGASDHIITGFSPHNDNGFISIVIATHRSKFGFSYWLY